jgi:ubiquinone/menaquinone biosynthesis C-methylase UbiE
LSKIAPGAVPSPNIWNHPHIYELENAAVDPAGVIESTMREVRPWTDATVLDIGCGTGYHLRRFAADAARVIGVEPHSDLVCAARRRVRDLSNVTVLAGSAQALPVPDRSVDVEHARWAYFFGPGCEPGLRELDRVMRPGGTAFVVDNDATKSTFGGWFARSLPSYDADEVDRFFSRHGWQVVRRTMRWSFARREDFESVIRIEFAPDLAELIVSEHSGLEVDYAIVIRFREF